MRRVLLRLAVVVVLAGAVPLSADGRSGHGPPPAAAALPARPNIVLILTDDQNPGSLPHTPPVMPYLQGRMSDPADRWVHFRNAFVNTPLCCPSRASILTGQYSHRHGVTDNASSRTFRESQTLATWLRGNGYRTAMIGKYLNNYPYSRGPYVPPGWDRWSVKQVSQDYYFNYTLIEDGVPTRYGAAATDYSTDVFARQAAAFIRSSAGRPFFLHLSPIAPHYPHTPPPRYARSLAALPPERPPNWNEADVSDKPAWVRSRPLMDAALVAEQDRRRLDSYRSLLAVDDAVRTVVTTLADQGVLEETVIFFLSDNGLSFGEHRWTQKLCAYDECIRTPLVVRYPGAASRAEDRLVSNVDLAPTILALTGTTPTLPQDGRNLVPLLEGTPPASWRTALLLYWRGNQLEPVPGYWGVRTPHYLYTELTSGERELYDLTGRNGTPDPYQLQNRAGRAAYGAVLSDLQRQLVAMRGW